MINWNVVTAALPQYWEGLQVTFALLAICSVSGFLIAVPLAMARASDKAWAWGPVFAFTYVIRGTPLLVQLFIVYYGLAQFEWIRDSAAWPLLRSAWFCAWFTFTLNTVAYTTEIFAGAIRATPWGEVEAARSYGMSDRQVFLRVFWPGAWRRALPQYGNEIIMLMHATALASTITIVELLRVSRDVYYNSLLVVEAFGTVAVIYFILTYAMTGVLKLVEKRYLRHLDPEASARAAPEALPEPTRA